MREMTRYVAVVALGLAIALTQGWASADGGRGDDDRDEFRGVVVRGHNGVPWTGQRVPVERGRGHVSAPPRRFDNHRPRWEQPELRTMSTYCPTSTALNAPSVRTYSGGLVTRVPRCQQPCVAAPSPYPSTWTNPNVYGPPRESYGYGSTTVHRIPRAPSVAADDYGLSTGRTYRVLPDGRWVPYDVPGR